MNLTLCSPAHVLRPATNLIIRISRLSLILIAILCCASVSSFAGGIFQKIASGYTHSLAIATNGTLWAWGGNGAGQLGNGSYDGILTATQIGTGTNWQSIAAGGSHSLAIKTDGTLWGWGDDGNGEVGDGGSPFGINVPVQIGTDTNWQFIAAGETHSLAIKTDGTLWAWGANANGQLGDGTTDDKSSPVQVGSDNTWQSASGGSFHSAAIKTNGTLWAWGDNTVAQVGNGSLGGTVTSPVQIGNFFSWKYVACGGNASFAIALNSPTNTVFAWGDNNEISPEGGPGALSLYKRGVLYATNPSAVTAYFHSAGDAVAVGTSGIFTGVLDNGQASCFGFFNTPPEYAFQDIPLGVSGITPLPTNVTAISVGDSFVIMLLADGTLYGSGNSEAGQLGYGATTNVQIALSTKVVMSVPVAVDGLSQTYDGTPKTVAVTGKPSAFNITYNGSSTPPTDAGSYTVNVTSADPDYYVNTNVTLVINQATPQIVLNDLTQIYDGTPKNISVTTTPDGLSLSVTYNSSSDAPTNAGIYAVSVTASNLDYFGVASNALVISQATAPIVLGNLLQYYDGTPKSISAATTPSGLTLNITYNGSPNAPTVIGKYPVVATINDLNYQGTATADLLITNLPSALAKGTYTGLFYQTTNVTHQSSGYFLLTVDPKGKIGGKIYIEDSNYPLTGNFNTNTYIAAIAVPRTSTGKSTLNIGFQLSSDGTSGTVSGTVSDGVWTAQLSGNKNYYSTTTPCPLAGNYALTFAGTGDGSTAPNFGTRGIVKVLPNGNISLSGQLADDVALTQSAVLSKSGTWPFYQKLYKGAGSALGWITFTNSPDYKLTGNVSWIKTTSFGPYYANGFTNQMTAYGSIRQ